MKICQILAGEGFGGLEKHTIELSNMLANRDIEVTVIANKEFEKFFNSDIKFISVDLNRSRNNIFLIYELYIIFKNEKFDIIHTQGSKATSIVTKIKPFISSKIVSTLHSLKSNIKPFEKSNQVITVSQKIGERLKNRNRTIYNGIKREKEVAKIDLNREFNIPTDNFIICSVARLAKVKRFDLLLKGIKNLTDVSLVLVGDGYEKENLKELAKNLSIESRVKFTGALENDKAKEIIASSSLFVMSSDKEGFPYTFVESMFCNTPFLSTPVSDISKIIGDKYIYPFGDELELENKIRSIMANYSDLLLDFKDIFKFAKKEFTVENMVEKTVEIYKEILSEMKTVDSQS